MASVYSIPLLLGTNDGSAVLTYTFPDTHDVYVLRHGDHFMSADPVGSAFSIHDDAECVIWAVTYGPHAGQWDHWDGRQVYYPGDHLFWDVTLGPLDNPATVRFSGYGLSTT